MAFNRQPFSRPDLKAFSLDVSRGHSHFESQGFFTSPQQWNRKNIFSTVAQAHFLDCTDPQGHFPDDTAVTVNTIPETRGGTNRSRHNERRDLVPFDLRDSGEALKAHRRQPLTEAQLFHRAPCATNTTNLSKSPDSKQPPHSHQLHFDIHSCLRPRRNPRAAWILQSDHVGGGNIDPIAARVGRR